MAGKRSTSTNRSTTSAAPSPPTPPNITPAGSSAGGTGGPSDSTEAKELAQWMKRIKSANTAYSEWAAEYRCDDLEDFWKGNQWLHETTGAVETGAYGVANEKYVINLCGPAVESKMPTLYFYRPKYKGTLRPPFDSDPGSDIEARMTLRELTLNTYVSENQNFQEQTGLALREAFFRFGAIEIGYSADFIENPNADRPFLHEDGSEWTDGGKPIPQPRRVPVEGSERVYVQRIPARNFRVSLNSKNSLEQCDWYGYFQWFYVEDLKAEGKKGRLENTEDLSPTGQFTREYKDENPTPDIKGDTVLRKGMVKVWKVWDCRAKRRFMFAEGHRSYLKSPEPYPFRQVSTLFFTPILDQWYPKPVMKDWLHPQIELNETRDMQKVHRRRAYRRYTYRDGSIDQDEIKKLESGGDLVYARANQDDPIRAVPDAPLDAATARISVPTSKQDFNEVSATPGEERGVADADTATQASIIDSRSRTREAYMRYQVSEWLSDIGTIIMKTMHEYMTGDIWVNMNVDPLSQLAEQNAEAVKALYRRIKAEDLGEMNYSMATDIDSLSPVSNELQRTQFNQAMSTIFASPLSIMIYSQSAILLKKQLAFFDIRDVKDVQEVQKALQSVIQMQQQQAMQAAQARAGAQGGGSAPTPAPTSSTPEHTIMANILASAMQAAPGSPVS